MTVPEAVRRWLRDGCGVLPKAAALDVGYLGAGPNAWALTLLGETRRQDIAGAQTRVCELALTARLPCGAQMEQNTRAQALFDALTQWLWAQQRAHRYPAPDGWRVQGLTAKNQGAAHAQGGTAVYTIHITMELEEE